MTPFKIGKTILTELSPLKVYQSLLTSLLSMLLSYGPGFVKTCLRTYADSEGPDQTAQMRLRCPLPELLDTIECISGKKGPDETLRMCRMI